MMSGRMAVLVVVPQMVLGNIARPGCPTETEMRALILAFTVGLVFRSNQMIQPVRTRPRQAALLRERAVNHLFDTEH